MTPAADPHGQNHTERVFLYALQALPFDEVAVVGAHIGGCAECRHEMEAFRPIIDAFAAWPADVPSPPASLWERLAQRIAGDRYREAMMPVPAHGTAPKWLEAAPGISYKVLAMDAERSRVSMLVRLAPGTYYPPHCHAGLEELHLLDGELMIGDRKLYPGDYNRAEPGTVDHRVWSETGCTCVLITSCDDILLS
jgi:anti-sigma factor ChrR (cupin superfamily)